MGLLNRDQFHPAVPALGAVVWPQADDPDVLKRAYVCADCHGPVDRTLRKRGVTPEFLPHPQDSGVNRWCEVHSGNVDKKWLRS